MKPTAGRIVKYINDEGNEQIAIMRHNDQTKEVQGKKKAYLRLLDSKLKHIEKDGKNATALVDIHKLQVIGMAD